MRRDWKNILDETNVWQNIDVPFWGVNVGVYLFLVLKLKIWHVMNYTTIQCDIYVDSDIRMGRMTHFVSVLI